MSDHILRRMMLRHLDHSTDYRLKLKPLLVDNPNRMPMLTNNGEPHVSEVVRARRLAWAQKQHMKATGQWPESLDE